MFGIFNNENLLETDNNSSLILFKSFEKNLYNNFEITNYYVGISSFIDKNI